MSVGEEIGAAEQGATREKEGKKSQIRQKKPELGEKVKRHFN